jgi:tetratricopeptide (TPR) repeat protein
MPSLLHHNQPALNHLTRAIALGAGQFSLILVRCNYTQLRSQLLSQLIPLTRAACLVLPADSLSLRDAVVDALAQDHATTPAALMVTGLEQVADLPALLRGANVGRDEFPKICPCPLVLWVNDSSLQQLAQFAADLKSFAAAPIRFDYPLDDLVKLLHWEADRLFATLLILGDFSASSPRLGRDYRPGSPLRQELEFALADIAQRGQPLDPALEASLDFLRGRDDFSRRELESSRQYFEKSLAYWRDLGENSPEISPEISPERSAQPLEEGLAPWDPKPSVLEKQAVLLFYLGVWWRSYGILQQASYQNALLRSQEKFTACLGLLKQAQRPDLVGRFIHALGDVLQKLGQWSQLKDLAQQGLTLHRDDPVRLARNYGFLAEVALAEQDWHTAQTCAQRALDILQIKAAISEPAEAPVFAGDDLSAPDKAPDKAPNNSPENAFERNENSAPKRNTDLDLVIQLHQGTYHHLLAQAQIGLGQLDHALRNLELAREQSDPRLDLTFYRQVLHQLRRLYFDHHQYRDAFHLKLELRQVENQFRLRAFIGAGELPGHSPATYGAGLKHRPDMPAAPAAIAAEIAASGRQFDVEALVARLAQPRYQLVVIHGQSGVGKSSLLEAGLIPALGFSFPEGRTSLPLLIKTYNSGWRQSVESAILHSRGFANAATMPHSSRPQPRADEPADVQIADLLTALRRPLAYNHQVVLIFDQFEEFLVTGKRCDRQQFYSFMNQCLKTPYLKVVLALREDYLHYLLEAERWFDLDTINNDILCRDVRYYLGNFSPAAADTVIRQLTEAANYPLTAALITQLVADLADDIGEIRPIELQVVGAELQRQRIQTLEVYRHLGPKPKEFLVQSFLQNVVRDCGPENEELAHLVLFLLTDETILRPLKTRHELEEELRSLGITFEPEQMDLVMDVLTGSGLVFELPEDPVDRYQLVHEYLVSFIRRRLSQSSEQTP